MWKEIQITDDDSINDFVALQKKASKWYDDTLTMELAKRDLSAEKHIGTRAFVFRGQHEINLVTTIEHDKVTMRLRNIGVGKVKDLPSATAEILSKIKQTLAEYGFKKVRAIWGIENVPQDVQDFYLFIANGFKDVGFVNTNLTIPRENIYEITTELP
jgi:hypothetical protein